MCKWSLKDKSSAQCVILNQFDRSHLRRIGRRCFQFSEFSRLNCWSPSALSLHVVVLPYSFQRRVQCQNNLFHSITCQHERQFKLSVFISSLFEDYFIRSILEDYFIRSIHLYLSNMSPLKFGSWDSESMFIC